MKNFDKFIELVNFTGDISSRYADKPLKTFFAEVYKPYSSLVDKRIAEGGFKQIEIEKEIIEDSFTITNGEFVPTKVTRKQKTIIDNKIDSDCLNMALYARDKLNGLFTICSYGQGHSIVLHLDEKGEVAVTCPYLNTIERYKHYAVPLKEYIKKFPDIRNENVGFAVYRNEEMSKSEMTLDDIMKMRYPHISLNIEDENILDSQIAEIKEILVNQQNTIKYKSPKNYEEFVYDLKLLPNKKSQIDYLFEYFNNETKYNYLNAELIELNKFTSDTQNNSSDFGVIEEIEKADNKKIPELLKEKFRENIGADFIIQKYKSKEIEGKIVGWYEPTEVKNATFGEARMKISEDIEKIKKEVNTDGLFKVGICGDFASFATKVLNDVGIECHSISGNVISAGSQKPGCHYWNLLKINGRYYFSDFTRATTLSHGHLPIKDVKPQDWILMSFDKFAELRKGFDITAVGSKYFSPITEKNITDVLKYIPKSAQEERVI